MGFNLITSIPQNVGTLSSGAGGNGSQGPLADLTNDNFTYNLYSYPIIPEGPSGTGHTIIFYINAQDGSFWNKNSITGETPPQPTLNRVGTASNFGLRTDQGTPGQLATNAFGGTGTTASGLANYVLHSTTTRTTDAISLYIPDTMVFSQRMQYENLSLLDATGALGAVGGAAAMLANMGGPNQGALGVSAASSLGAVLPDLLHATGLSDANALTGDGIRQAFNKAVGIADNPQNFLLFKQIDFRKFQFEFILTPENPQEAQLINKILYLFRFHSAPEVLAGTAGRFFVPPSEFDIQIMHNGQINPNIPQINTCVLTNVTVDFGAAGHWMTNVDGQPTQIALNLQFTETSILTKDLIQEGF